MVKDADVIIVGAGLAGLRAAIEVANAGLSVIVLEREMAVGGRMRTSVVNGFRLDHGFQVVLSAYPELKRIPGLNHRRWRAFASGARVRSNGAFFDFMDPRKHPESVFSMLRSPLCSIFDLTRLLLFVATAPRSEPQLDGVSIGELLRKQGFSDRFTRSFLRPFLRGVTLDAMLMCDAGPARFYLRCFSTGDAVLPPNGIQGLPEHLASLLGSAHIRLGTGVKEISAKRVVLENGETLTCDQVVCATDTLSAAALKGPEQTMPHNGCVTLYFGADRAPFAEPLLVLNGDDGPISHLAVLTNVEPSYAPANRALISVTLVGNSERSSETELLSRVTSQLREWYGPQVEQWEYLARYNLPNALPGRPRVGSGWIEREGILFAGDYLSYPSQNGALAAGRRAGEAIVGSALGQNGIA